MTTVSLFIGQVQALPVSGRPTAMYKTLVQDPIELGVEGLIGDQHADLRVHGPLLEKAAEFLQQHPDVQAQFASMKNIKQTLEKGLVLFGN